jgi:glycosyltransferase involved in cell wall biosynthesis
MKIVLYCFAFSPTIGGIQTIAETLATNFVKLGHTCVVITESTTTQDDKEFSFLIVRKPNKKKIYEIIKKSDIIFNVELSLKFFWLSQLARKPLVWIHNGYKLMCLDALGWYLDKPAPINPIESIRFYSKEKGYIYAIVQGFKLYVRRWASSKIYLNIAATKWIAERQPLKNQVQLYTPYFIHNFLKISDSKEKKYDFLFVGRLVREKGIDTLLCAFEKLIKGEYNKLKLAIVGYGSDEEYLKTLSKDLDLTDNVYFLGPKKGENLFEIISQSEIGVVPSYWEEPMGGVSLELMAAGKIVIVSKNGGMPEVIGEAGLTFENGNSLDLYDKMNLVLSDNQLKMRLKANREIQISKFDPLELTKAYIDIVKIKN